MKPYIWPHLNPPNLITLSGLLIGFGGVVFASNHRFSSAVACLAVTGLVDLLDGLVARKTKRTEEQAEVGKQLDSLADLGMFGIYPALIAWYAGVSPIIGMLFVLASALRLAYFNVAGSEVVKETGCYRGLPTTYVGMWFPILVAILGFSQPQSLAWILGAGMLVHVLLMHLPVPFVKPRGKGYAIFGGMAIALFIALSVLGNSAWVG